MLKHNFALKQLWNWALVLALLPLLRFPIDFKIFQWKCPFQKKRFKAWLCHKKTSNQESNQEAILIREQWRQISDFHLNSDLFVSAFFLALTVLFLENFDFVLHVFLNIDLLYNIIICSLIKCWWKKDYQGQILGAEIVQKCVVVPPPHPQFQKNIEFF